MGSSKLVDLGQQLEIELDAGCWNVVSMASVNRLILKGNLRAMENSLAAALAILQRVIAE